jgi:ABC-type molybdate transport system substrate-binding protein
MVEIFNYIIWKKIKTAIHNPIRNDIPLINKENNQIAIIDYTDFLHSITN